MDHKLETFLGDLGWTIECESPLEIRHTDGSFATLQAADYLILGLKQDYNFEQPKTQNISIKDLIAHSENLINVVNIANLEDTYQSWDIAYNLIFSVNGKQKIDQMLDTLNLELDYYDPDTSYKEDVLAYTNALTKFIQSMRPFAEINLNAR